MSPVEKFTRATSIENLGVKCYQSLPLSINFVHISEKITSLMSCTIALIEKTCSLYPIISSIRIQCAKCNPKVINYQDTKVIP